MNVWSRLLDPNFFREKKTMLTSHLNKFQEKSDMGDKKVQVGKDQEKAQSEKDSHSKNRGGKKPN